METTIESIWTKSKILVKGGTIGLIALVLLIPVSFVSQLVSEREARQKEATLEVSNKWAGKQTVRGPMLVLPYWQYDGDSAVKGRSKHFANFLPDVLHIDAAIAPKEKYRGIYKVMLYSVRMNLTGSFSNIQTEQVNIPPGDVIWNEAFVQLDLADAKGLNDELKLTWNDQLLSLSPGVASPANPEAVTAPLHISGPEELKNIRFAASLDLNGSEQMLFTPTGKTTTVRLSSSWPHPSFTGNILPQSTQVKDSGFTASWKSLAFRRHFPQQWKDNAFLIYPKETRPAAGIVNNISDESFGVDLIIPVNSYRKTMRSVKYAALCILLTFASFFLIDTGNNKNVHPFQYGLIGGALIVFYTLLLSLSEYMGFDISYVIASVMAIGLIAWFVKGLLGSAKLTLILSGILLLMYTYLFTILQLQDYSLLLGSVGLFLTLAVLMYFSKKFKW